MRRAAQALAARLAAASAKLAAPGATMCGQAAPGRHGPGAAAAAAAAATVLAAGAQWGLAEAPHPAREQQPKAEQQQGQDGQQAECPTCPDVSLEDQPVAISNSATAQWRVFTDMGRELVQQGRHGEAERYFKKAVEMAREGFGEDDPHMASACNNLAEFYRIRRQYDAAEPLYRQALEVLTRAYGLHDARVAFALHNLGGFYLSQRKLEQAAECYEQALKMKLEVLGTGHSETSNSMYHLAEVRWQQGQHDAAVRLMEHSLEIMEAQGVGATPGCVRRRSRLAEMLLERDRVEDAEKLLRNILGYVVSTQGLEHANYANAAENLAAALQRKGQWEEARELMHKALETRSTHVGARHPVVAITLRKLAELELAAADAEEAAAAAAGQGSSSSDAAPAAAQSSSSKASGKAGGKGSPAAAPQLPLKDRERRQAVAIAEEALSISQQAYGESLEWRRRQGQPESGGLLGWLRPKPTLAALRRPQRPDSAALEVGHCLHTLSHAHAAVAQPAAAATDLEAGLKLLDDAFPEAAAARAVRVDEPEEQRADQQEVSAPPSRGAAGSRNGSNGSSNSSGEGSSSEEEDGGNSGGGADVNAQAAANLAAAVSAKEAARAQRVEQARKQLACAMLAELLVLAAGGEADLAAVQERWAQEGCAAS